MKKNKRFIAWAIEFVAYRKLLGYKMIGAERDIRNLAEFMDREAPGQSLTDAWILRWREANVHRSPRMVYSLRAFVPWLTLRDPQTTVSERWLHQPRYPRLTPYI